MSLVDVIADFLAELSESDFYLPFFGLLVAEGFEDIHFTHGHAEFGKDFVAKRRADDGDLEQWCFQLKAGNINQGSWRNEVMGQILEASTQGLGHPSFDQAMPRRVVLVTTGRLVGNASVGFQNLNRDQLVPLGRNPAIVWDMDHLKLHFAEGAINALLPKGDHIAATGVLLQIYGRALEGKITAPELEGYSRVWLTTEGAPSWESLAAAAMQAAVLAEALRRQGQRYEEGHCYLALVRAALHLEYRMSGDQRVRTVLRFAHDSVLRSRGDLTRSVATAWRAQERNAIRAFPDAMGGAAQYLVQCARIAESAALVALYSSSEEEVAFARGFLLEWVEHEPGASRPLSDKYAVSLVWTLLALWAAGSKDACKSMVQRSANWLFDRYDSESCLAGVETPPSDEVRALLGNAFDFIDVKPRRQSLAATALADFAAFANDGKLYEDLVNDTQAVDICPEYVQCDDTIDQFKADGDALKRYMNVRFSERLEVANAAYADHVAHEPESFRVAQTLGAKHYVALSLLLRDRYFPKLWARL